MLEISNDYIGVIVSAELTENNGKVGAIVVVRPDGSPQTARWYGSFSDTVIGGQGRNAGKMVGEVTAETLGSFGCSDFSKIGDVLPGQRVAFGVKHKPDKDDPEKMWAEVNFIRPPRVAKPVTSAGLAGINRFKGAALEAARSAPKPAPKPSSQQSGSGGHDDDYGPTDYGGGGSSGGDDIPF
jgi:hypothetical protein